MKTFSWNKDKNRLLRDDKLKLDSDEQELLDSYEGQEWQSVGELSGTIEQVRAYATAMLEAEGLVTLALPRDDFEAIRRQAAEAGISYQHYIARIVHNFVAGRLVERPSG